jgi:hypothetical protein
MKTTNHPDGPEEETGTVFTAECPGRAVFNHIASQWDPAGERPLVSWRALTSQRPVNRYSRRILAYGLSP